MAQRMPVDNGQHGRSVMGMLEVQVERDPKTGTTTVRSVTPMSSPAGVSKATTVFDDGRKSIHTVSRLADQPSTQELDQILNVVSGVGMKVLLDEVTVTPSKAEIKTENAEVSPNPNKNALSFITHDAMSKKQLDSSGSNKLENEMKMEKCVSVRYSDDKTMMVVGDTAETEADIVGNRLEEDPVTLLFLGYTDATADQGQEDHEGMLTAERVIITEEGEELIFTPEMSESLLSPATQQEEKEIGNKGAQDVPLGGDGAEVKVQGEGKEKGKCKTCQCCCLM
ncbi:uncharacterized protein LOC108247488 [Kryptolebias marmoratus]|uniref:uncharacterized protein LOC108247488 n=1 Tax=Kryptolebias marmoratus TaxID=37003 RepID=UPI0007F8F860|nr:uncharacterized protein LOC108247488 [Kryptolebias marmoratus]